ncbi:MAG: 30S ribosomal protein S5 [Candidatus Aenigmatarchaeota archaeon]
MAEEQTKDWTPHTELGKEVVDGKITSVEEIFEQGKKIMEPEIVDLLVPNLDHELILIGGSPGKGGGMRRTPAKRTAKMHKSGRKYKMTAFAVVGNSNGYVGVGEGQATGSGAFRTAIQKAIKNAKLNIIPVRRGCGSWECECASPHSLPTEIEGSEGSIRVVLKPAPRGVGLVVSDEVKKFMKLAGVEDCWIKTFGETRTRTNLIKAVYNAFNNLNHLRMEEDFKEKTGTVMGEI